MITFGAGVVQATFTGQEYDDENASQYFINRYYDNKLGRFTSIDPALFMLANEQSFTNAYQRSPQVHLANPQNLNSYSYSLNNPVNVTDRDGQIPIIPLMLIVAEIGFSTWDAQTAGSAWFGENTSKSDKGWAGFGLAAGLILPGPGGMYDNAGKTAINGVKNVSNIKWNQVGSIVLEHFKKHKDEFAKIGIKFENSLQYAKSAKEFVFKQGDNFKYFFDSAQNAMVKWDAISHEFIALTKEGNIKTFFMRDFLNPARFIETTIEEFNKIFK